MAQGPVTHTDRWKAKSSRFVHFDGGGGGGGWKGSTSHVHHSLPKANLAVGVSQKMSWLICTVQDAVELARR